MTPDTYFWAIAMCVCRLVPPLGIALTEGKRKYVNAVFSHGLHQEGVQAYLASTAYVDAQLGRVLDALDRSPYLDGSEELYDTFQDPHEWTNVIDDPKYGPLLESMRAAVPVPPVAATSMPEELSKARN